MRLNYIINCSHCGSLTEYKTSLPRTASNVNKASIYSNIDTECAIRCPKCRARLNNTASEFFSQVEIQMVG
ncbi:MAG: hypothetical protein J6U93_00335 [Alistipes sp.]|nr:hypothetical protein [Alistipes sp.]MBO7262950.1 hypothetical protein [Alistipes sp.]